MCLADATQAAINKLFPVHNKITRKSYRMVMEVGGLVELEEISGRAHYVNRADLDNSDVWERLS